MTAPRRGTGIRDGLSRLVLHCRVAVVAKWPFGRPPLADHSFDFRPRTDSPWMKILDWRYGECKPEEGQTEFVRGARYGLWGCSVRKRFRVGDHIYVKWTVPPSRAEFERRISLAGLLPESMELCELRLIFVEHEPHVFLISHDSNELPFRFFFGRGYTLQSIWQIYPTRVYIKTEEQLYHESIER